MNKFQALLESYGMMTRQQRLFYPRNFNLSPEFIAALKKEIEKQHKAGMDLGLFERKLTKALQFFTADFKKSANMKRANMDSSEQAARDKEKEIALKVAAENKKKAS